MTYLDKIENIELKTYMEIFSEDFPSFLDKYIETNTMQNLNGKGQFCGSEYTKLHSCKMNYTRLHHSVVSALMTWHFTSNKTQTIAALLHDIGTPSFSHCIDFLLHDSENQCSSERSTLEVLEKDPVLLNLLASDGIELEQIINLKKYSIVENEKPKLCVDRLDGVLHTAFIWQHFWELKDIKEIYQNMKVLINEEGKPEIGFTDTKIAEKFSLGSFRYSIALQRNESIFSTQFIADVLKELMNRNLLSLDDLYQLSEKEIIEIIEHTGDLKDTWHQFTKAKKIVRTNEYPKDEYVVSVKSKKRYVLPLVYQNRKTQRVNKVSKYANNLLKTYLLYKDTEYSYVEGLYFNNNKNRVLHN